MATARPLPTTPLAGLAAESGPAGVAEPAAERGLVNLASQEEPAQFIAPNSPLSRLPVEVDVAVPVRDFRVRHLLALEPGEVIETEWSHGEDMPLAAGLVQLAWSEFEVVDTQLAVRVTRLV